MSSQEELNDVEKSKTALYEYDGRLVILTTYNAAVQVGKPVKVKVITANVSDHDVTYWRENSLDLQVTFTSTR